MKNKRLLIIFGIMLVNMLALGIIAPLIPYLGGEVGASNFDIGLLMASYPLAQLIGAPILGRLSDRYGRKPILMVSIFGTAVGFALLAVAHSLAILYLSRIIDGLTGGNINVAQAYITDVTDREERGRAMGLIGAAFGLGFVLGPVASGLLSGISYALPAWLGMALSLANLALVATLLPESLSAEAREALGRLKQRVFDLAEARHAFSHPRVRPLLSIRAITGLSLAMYETMFALWGIAALALSAGQTGLLLGYVGVLSVLVQGVAIGPLTKRFSDDTLLISALVSSGVALLFWGFSPSVFALVLVIPFIAYGLGVGQTVMTSALSKAVHHDEVGGVLGVQTSVMSLARVIAPIIGGFLLEHAPVWTPGVFAGALTLAVLPYAWNRLCRLPGRASCEGGAGGQE